MNATAPLASRFDGFVLDLDGVVYVGDRGVPGAADTINALLAAGKPVVFVTNDPRGRPESYRARLAALGIAVRAEDILTSGAATARHLAPRAADARVYVTGSAELKEELRSVGLTLLEGARGSVADVVVVGGHERFDYEELRVAGQAVLRGAELLATNRDLTFPMPDGPWPATGTIVAAIEAMTSTTAVTVGKPGRIMFDLARQRMPGGYRVAVVGDSLDSDIAGGRAAGLATVLVLTGSTRQEHLAGAAVAPDHVLPDLAALLAGAEVRSAPPSGRRPT